MQNLAPTFKWKVQKLAKGGQFLQLQQEGDGWLFNGLCNGSSRTLLRYHVEF
jgi:hypothetical protein